MPKVAKMKTITPIITTNTGVSRAGWQIDYRALDIVRDIEKQENLGIDCCLEIQFPIKFRFMAGKYRDGTHYIRRDSNGDFYHFITLNQDNSLEEANETLWHELVHCHQSEAWAKENNDSIWSWHNKSYKTFGKTGYSYQNNPYEIQAREVAAQNKCIRLLKEV